MNVYDVLQSTSVNTKELIRRCIRDIHGADRESARDWYEQITGAFPNVKVEPSTYTMLCVACPDKIFRILAIDAEHIDEYFDKEAASIIAGAPDLQEIPFSKLLGMEVLPNNFLDVGSEKYAEAFLRAMLPGIDTRAYWALRRVRGCSDGKLAACIKDALNYLN